jgi:sialate O-acetylesterase
MRLQVSPLISNGMVMQEGASIPIRGEAAPGAAITALFRGKTYYTRADSDGTWRLFLDKQVSGGPYTLEISAGTEEKLIINDIYIGDVWICSGQSNMEMPMQRLRDNFPEEWDPPVNSLIRQFKVPQEWDFSGPREDLRGGAWAAASPETLNEFSGTAWFFARTLYEKRPLEKHSLEKRPVPVGLINAAWGGTPAEAWMSSDALAAFPEKIALGRQFADTAFCDAITQKKAAVIKAWNDELTAADSGLTQAWQRPETDISSWGEITLPGDFADVGLKSFCGALWLCKEFEASEAFARDESRLWLGTIVDADTAYINGEEIGNTGYRYPPRKYPVPAGLLHAGKNRIVIRVVCCNGGGGVTRSKDFRLFSENDCIELSGIWKYRIGINVSSRPEEFFLQRLPMGLFNAMIAPILGYPCRGILWYQGESNDSKPSEYAALLSALINDWRDKKQQALPEPLSKEGHDLPFLLVQLPIFGAPGENNESSSWAIIREAQYAALSLPATGMAAALDLGEWNDLHPLNKKDVGRRLALAAERLVFKNENTAPGPILRGIEKRGGKLLISFDNSGGGLTSDEQPYVSVIADGKNSRLPAEITGPDCLSVDISSVKNPETLLYAWANNPRDRQLYNAEGLPVIPFRVNIKD